MSAPRAAAQLFPMPVPLGHSFRRYYAGGPAQRAIPTIMLNRYRQECLRYPAKHKPGKMPAAH